MPARKPPTERQRRLGAELRKMRERVGLSLTEAAALHRVDKTTISNTESARFGVSGDRVRVWAGNYSCPDQKYIDVLAEMARERGSNWWDEFRDQLPAGVLDLAELEHHAAAFRSVQITHMPGLLQHEEYVRAVFAESVPQHTAEDLERRVSFRVRRACVLDGPEPPQCTFLVHEAALCMRFGGSAVTKNQLNHLLEQSERDHVTIRVVPFTAGGFPSSGSSTLYAYGPVAALDTVQSDTPGGSRFLHSETHLSNYRVVLDRTEQRALSPDRSPNFIREILQRL